MAVIEQNPIDNFFYALKSSESRRQYPKRFEKFLNFLGFDGSLEDKSTAFLLKARQDIQWADGSFMKFLEFQKSRNLKGEIATGTVVNYYRATKLFCEMNDLQLSWKKIARGLPKPRKASNDRAPTAEELRKLIEYPDRRIKSIVFTMASSGIRIGAWDFLKWKHIIPQKDTKGEILASKLAIYAGEPEEYYTFISPEAHNALSEWMNFRASYGEKISGESWVMRDLWQTTNMNYGAKWGLATSPKQLKSLAIKRLLDRALWEQGIRQKLPIGVKRHEWKEGHGYRKFFKSHAEQVMGPANVERLMGHDLGVSESYWKPTKLGVLQDYLKAVDLLTINGNEQKLSREVEELKGKSKDSEYVIKGRLEEKDNQIEFLMEKQAKTEELIQSLIDSGQIKSVKAGASNTHLI
jgi:integrase